MPYWFSIDNHLLEIVEMDGIEVEPIKTTRVFMNPGQRYSVMVNTNQTAGNYLMRALAATHCFHLPATLWNARYEATGILSYDNVGLGAIPIDNPWDIQSKNNPGVGKEPWNSACHDLPFNLARPIRQKPAYEVGDRNYHYFNYKTGMIGDVSRTSINKVRSLPFH
jgi:hypothetical protein